MTFQVTNLNTNKISEFANRAQFLYEMEQIETRHLATNTMGRYKLTHLILFLIELYGKAKKKNLFIILPQLTPKMIISR